MQKKYVGFVFGGESAESDVSVVTMLGLEKQLRGVSEFEPIFLYVSKDLDFYLVPSKFMVIDSFKNPQKTLSKFQVVIEKGGIVRRKKSIKKTKLFVLDAVINCMHGGVGESGQMSGLFQVLQIPFSTYSSLAMGLSMNKNLFKLVLRSSGILVPNWVYFSKKDWESGYDKIKEKVAFLRYPVVVKPNASGSSLGVRVVTSEDELDSAINIAFEFDCEVIIEKFVHNKVEFNCAVLGGRDGVIVSDVDEIESNSKLFSFEEKYIGSSSEEKSQKNSQIPNKKTSKGMEFAPRLLPAPISPSLTEKIQEISALVFKTLGLSGISRVDFLYDKKKKKLYVGEINAVPGSMALYFFKKSKLGIHGVISKLVQIAKNEHTKSVIVDKQFVPKIF